MLPFRDGGSIVEAVSGLAAFSALRHVRWVTAAPKLSTEFETERALAARIREPMGAVRLAVQILAGPMARALEQLDEVTRARVQSVLQTLEQSTKQVCDVLAGFPVSESQAPAANGPVIA